jgi:predicted nucleotidyltransferase
MNNLINDDFFKKKYFKYKQKYLNLKESIIGGYPENDDGFITVIKKKVRKEKKEEKKEERLLRIDDIKCNVEFINLLKKYKPLSVIVYGSTARGTNNPTSDIDFMIIWKKEINVPPVEELQEIKQKIINIFKKRIDFVSMVPTTVEVDETNKNYHYMHNVYNEGIVVYGDILKANILFSRKVSRT